MPKRKRSAAIPSDALEADVSRQLHGSDEKPYYTDVLFECPGCGKTNVWTKEQQKKYFEVRGAHVDNSPRWCNCKPTGVDDKSSPFLTYDTGWEIREGDIVLYARTSVQKVAKIFRANTEEAAGFCCEENGGVLLEPGSTLLPVESRPWEDLELLQRGCE